MEEEMKGIDASQHGGRSYTEFQTTVFKFKTASGMEHSMEMRVRAGDAAKFAMALSEVMEGSNRSSEAGSGHDARQNNASTNRSMVFINNQPVGHGQSESETGGSSRGGSSRGASAHGEGGYTHIVYDGHHPTGAQKSGGSGPGGPTGGVGGGGLGGGGEHAILMPPSGLAGLMSVREETGAGGSAGGSGGGGGGGGVGGSLTMGHMNVSSSPGYLNQPADGGRGKNGVPLDPFADASYSAV